MSVLVRWPRVLFVGQVHLCDADCARNSSGLLSLTVGLLDFREYQYRVRKEYENTHCTLQTQWIKKLFSTPRTQLNQYSAAVRWKWFKWTLYWKLTSWYLFINHSQRPDLWPTIDLASTIGSGMEIYYALLESISRFSWFQIAILLEYWIKYRRCILQILIITQKYKCVFDIPIIGCEGTPEILSNYSIPHSTASFC